MLFQSLSPFDYVKFFQLQ